MSINLDKGENIDLTKGNANLKSIRIGLGWDTNLYDGGHQFDLDASVFVTDENDKCQSDKDFVYYKNLVHPSGAITHSGDNKDGNGEGDDETIFMDLQKVPASCEKVYVVATIHDAVNRGQNFGQVNNAYIRIVNEDTNEEIGRYDLVEDFSIETALVVGEVYRHKGEWKFKAIGSGYQGGLAALVERFGLSVA